MEIQDGTAKFVVCDKRLFKMLNILYPVGIIYITMGDETPFADIGFGTWEKISSGMTLVSSGSYTDSNGTVTYMAGDTGGERQHQLTVDEMPSHTHDLRSQNDNMNASGISSGKKYRGFADDSTADWKTWNDMVLSKGGDEFHNNMQPYMVTNMYKRIY